MSRPSDPGPLSVAILAGGASSRMGTDKALVGIDGEPMLARIARRLAPVTDDLFVVGSDRVGIDVRTVEDVRPDRAALAGVLTALGAAGNPFVFVCACDMPMLDAATVRSLAEVAGVAPAVARTDGRLEPLAAVWPVTLLARLEAMWDEGERAVHRALARCAAVAVDVEASVVTNINTPRDLEAFREPR